jgi:glycosyltransferase involved in cell wall biosynthesis
MLSNELVRKGHTVDVIAKDTDEQNLFRVVQFNESHFSMKDESYRPTSEERGQQNYQSLQYGLFDTSQYDVIHYNSYVPEMYEMGALHDVPSVVTLRLPPFKKFKILYRLFVKNKGATAVAISSRMQKQWQNVLNTHPVTILNGIELDRWPLREKSQNGYLLWSGRIAKEKNVEAAIQIANYLHMPLKIVGPIFDNDYYEVHVKPHLNDHIEHVTHTTQSQISEVAAGASIALATALWDEPFGLSTVEMLASGIPVLGFSTAIPPELRHDSVSIAVDSDDWRDLVPHIEKLKNAYPSDCREFAQQFSISKTADAYINLFKNVIGRVRNNE